MKTNGQSSKNCKPTIGFIGAGTTGTALAVRLSMKGYPVVAVSSKTPSSAQRLADLVPGCKVYTRNQDVADNAQLVFITTPDDIIAPVAASLKWHSGQGVVHCSGAASLDILAPTQVDGADIGAIHPLQTFASVGHAIENIPGSMFGIEADEPLFSILRDMAVDLDGSWVKLDAGDKVLYHAAAVIACNYFVTLVKQATDLWSSFGIDHKQATQALIPLLRGTLNNIDNIGIPECLTGPIARGDTGTVNKHISALEKSAPEVLSTYLEMGLQTLPIATAKGKIDKESADAIQTLLKEEIHERDAERQNPSRASY
ncbi:MAG: DUF2520 domain-containing protein [Chloroflexota bacterium]|nr:DUF2520 domain-containing protein [Chloroflexota bacterium]